MVFYKEDMTSVNFSCRYHQSILNQFVYIETKQHENQDYLLCNSSTVVVCWLHTLPHSYLHQLNFLTANTFLFSVHYLSVFACTPENERSFWVAMGMFGIPLILVQNILVVSARNVYRSHIFLIQYHYIKKITRNSIKTYQSKLYSRVTELVSVLTDLSTLL